MKMLKIIRRCILILSLLYCAGPLVLAQDTEQDAKDYYKLGNIYYQQGRYKESEELYQKALDILQQKEITPAAGEQKIKIEKGTEETPVSIPQREVPAAQKANEPAEYIVGAEDVLNISVWQNPDLDKEVIVRPDGMLSFPLVGDIRVSGLTVTQLDQELTEKLKEYIKYPEVSISIKKLGGKKVIVLGEVMSPGVYSLTGARNILEAVGLAGGFTNHAVASSVVVIRGGFNNPKAERINLTKALTGDRRQNIALDSEDVIFVPKKFIANLNYFLTQVLDPLSKGVYTSKELRNW